MEDQYYRILHKISEYDKQHLVDAIICLVMLFVLLCILRYKLHTKTDRIIKLSIILIIPIAFIFGLIHHGQSQKQIEADIDNKQFVKYDGEFTHKYNNKTSYYGSVYIIGPMGIKVTLTYPEYDSLYDLYPDSNALPVGTYTGTIIYAKDSKIIVDWTIEE